MPELFLFSNCMEDSYLPALLVLKSLSHMHSQWAVLDASVLEHQN